jgi:hypothetical protein
MEIENIETGERIQFHKQVARIRRCQKRVHAWAAACQEYSKDTRRYIMVMVTLTYEHKDAWKPLHISEYMQAVKKFMKDDLVGYAWVSEMQRRGAPHYHVLFLLKRGRKLPKPDKSGMWKHGMSKIEPARKIFYIVSYTGKEYQKMSVYPRGLRMFGVYLNKDFFSVAELRWFRLSALPVWLVEKMQVLGLIGLHPKRDDSGKWHVGEYAFKSPWRLVSVN